jgi:hypothetical protein
LFEARRKGARDVKEDRRWDRRRIQGGEHF